MIARGLRITAAVVLLALTCAIATMVQAEGRAYYLNGNSFGWPGYYGINHTAFFRKPIDRKRTVELIEAVHQRLGLSEPSEIGWARYFRSPDHPTAIVLSGDPAVDIMGLGPLAIDEKIREEWRSTPDGALAFIRDKPEEWTPGQTRELQLGERSIEARVTHVSTRHYYYSNRVWLHEDHVARQDGIAEDTAMYATFHATEPDVAALLKTIDDLSVEMDQPVMVIDTVRSQQCLANSAAFLAEHWPLRWLILLSCAALFGLALFRLARHLWPMGPGFLATAVGGTLAGTLGCWRLYYYDSFEAGVWNLANVRVFFDSVLQVALAALTLVLIVSLVAWRQQRSAG